MKSMRAAIIGVFWAGQSFAGNPPPLFNEVFSASQPTPPRTEAAYPVTVNFPPLDGNPESLQLQLPASEAGTHTANRVRFESRPAGGYHWVGKTDRHDVILTVDGDLITGFIRGGGDTYSLISGSAGGNTSHVLMRMNAESFPTDYVDGEDQVANSVA